MTVVGRSSTRTEAKTSDVIRGREEGRGGVPKSGTRTVVAARQEWGVLLRTGHAMPQGSMPLSITQEDFLVEK